jgi:hypothetical protein
MCSFILFITYNFLISMPSHIHIRLLRTVALCLYQQLPVREVLSVWSSTLNSCWMVRSGATAKVAVAVVTAPDLPCSRGAAVVACRSCDDLVDRGWLRSISFWKKNKSSHWCPRTGQVFQMEPRRKIGIVHGGVHGGFSGKNTRMSMLGYFWTYISFIYLLPDKPNKTYL